jgi:hypothetical protein
LNLPEPKRATAACFYKYSGLQDSNRLAWLKSLILENQIYLPTLDQLNDPADGRPVLKPLSEEQMFEFLFQAGRNPNWTMQQQVRENLNLRRNIRLHGPEFLHRQMTDLLNKEMETYRVYSMSKRFNNMALWAKYADEHRGYCLEFANVGPFFAKCVEVLYGDSIPIDVTNPNERTSFSLYCKRPDWSNEEEVRVVRMRHSVGHDKIQPEWLTQIILGKAISLEHETSIQEWAVQRRPALMVVKAHFDYADQTIKLR